MTHPPFHSPDFWLQACQLRDAHPAAPWSDEERKELRRVNLMAGAPDPVLRNIDALADPRTLVVVTGQQPGLFLTPLYIVYKAIATVKWAHRLAEILQRPVVPVFWIASDDHDFDEIRSAAFLNADGALCRWTYSPRNAGQAVDGRSIFDIACEKDNLLSFFDELDRATRSFDHKEDFIGRWRDLTASSDNLETLFARLLMDLLGPHALVLLPSRLMPLRKRAQSILRREIENPGESSRLVRQSAEEIKRQGSEPPLHRQGNEANFFLYRAHPDQPGAAPLRCKVTVSDGAFLVAHPFSGSLVEKTDAAALLDELQNQPEHFSPNVVTRPLVQDTALPTIAMVGGPNERKYLAQLGSVYACFGVPQPPVLPRPRFLLIEPRIERPLAKLSISDEAVAAEDPSALRDLFLRQGDSGSVLAALEEMRAAQQSSFAAMTHKWGDSFAQSPAIQSASRKTLANIAQSLDMLEKRVREEIQRSESADAAHLDKTLSALSPQGQPQERVLGPLAPFLFQYGPNLISAVLKQADMDSTSLQILHLSSIGSSAKS